MSHRSGYIRLASFGESPYLMIAVVIHVSRQTETRRQIQLSLHHLRLDELLQICAAQPAVPVISDVTPIHDLTEEIAQVIIWHLDEETTVQTWTSLNHSSESTKFHCSQVCVCLRYMRLIHSLVCWASCSAAPADECYGRIWTATLSNVIKVMWVCDGTAPEPDEAIPRWEEVNTSAVTCRDGVWANRLDSKAEMRQRGRKEQQLIKCSTPSLFVGEPQSLACCYENFQMCFLNYLKVSWQNVLLFQKCNASNFVFLSRVEINREWDAEALPSAWGLFISLLV